MLRYSKTLILLIAFSLIALTSCDNGPKKSQVLSEVVSDNNISTIVEKIKADPDMTKEDIDLFNVGLARLGSIDSIKGKSVAQIIDLQKERQRKSALNNLLVTSINLYHQFGFIGWEPATKDTNTFNVFKFAIYNKSKKDIKEVQGLLKFVTSNNQLIRAFPIVVNAEIKAGSSQPFQSTYKLDKNSKSDVLLHQLLTNKAPNVVPVWQPRKIRLSDGTEISVAKGKDKKKEEPHDKEDNEEKH